MSDRVSVSDDAVRLAGRLAASLTAEQRVIFFTETAAGHDVSAVAAEVALAFARMSREQVLLVDAHVDDPILYERFGVKSTPGLTDILRGAVELEPAIAKVGEGVMLLPLGSSSDDYVGLFASESFAVLLARLRKQYRLIVVDSSPLLLSAPASVLASRADGVVAVVGEGRSHKGDVAELKRVIDGLKIALVGAVLTLADTDSPSRGRGKADPVR